MAVVESLLAAIARADGDGLVMHVGEKPYVIAPAGPVEISSKPLTLDAASSILNQLLPSDSQRALQELGAVAYDLPAASESGDRFSVIAARGGDDVWVELRRHKAGAVRTTPTPDPVAQQIPAAAVVTAAVGTAVRSTPSAGLQSPMGATLTTSRLDTEDDDQEPQPAVVVPLSRPPVRTEPTRLTGSQRIAGLDRLLRVAAGRGASTLYIVAQAKPFIRVDGEVTELAGEHQLTSGEVESLILELAPERSREALQTGAATEWMSDIPEVGRVRCLSFRDHRGPGGIFRMIPQRAISADQLGLSREIQALCAEPEGFILVTGPRSSGKSTLVSAFVDLINRTRCDHVITLESQIKFVHESRSSVVSQREVRGDNDEWLAAARAALRENPDVLIIEELRSPELIALALDAAESGHLVIGSLTAYTTTAAIVRVLDQFPSDRRPQIQLALAEAVRGVVGQVLLRKAGGGRVAAREVLLNTPAIANLIAEGKISQLPLGLEGGRKYGMVPLNDALVAFVQSGAVEAREAYRKAFDREGFLSLLKREGIDSSFVERLA
ncbi:MAG: Flp pilus assembly complex ATPase component TadA [Acidobacteria bacterium]|nr:Flp pilus assembly complex ATPase component TadA [Acidobacteriota bacterium]